MKRYGILLGLSFIFPALDAATLSFLVIETGADSAPIHEYSWIWENALMDLSFDLGHIVSNAPIMQIKSSAGREFPDEAGPYLDAVNNGNFEFFILVLLNYGKENLIQKLQSVSLKLYRAKTFALLCELNYGAGVLSAREEFSRAKSAAQVLFNSVP
jgi:hypothetical protein